MSWHIKLIWHPLICLPPTVKALVLVSEACSALSCFSNGRLRQPQGPTVLGHRCPGSAWVPGLLPSCFSRASRWDLMVRSSFQCGPQAQARPQHLRSAHPASALSPRASSTGPKAASFYNRLIHPFARTLNKYVLHSCCVPVLGQVLGIRYSAPDL